MDFYKFLKRIQPPRLLCLPPRLLVSIRLDEILAFARTTVVNMTRLYNSLIVLRPDGVPLPNYNEEEAESSDDDDEEGPVEPPARIDELAGNLEGVHLGAAAAGGAGAQ